MKSMKPALLAVALAFALAPAPATADLQPEDAGLVPLFLQTCTRPDMNAEAILVGVAGTPDWIEVSIPDVDLPALEQVPSRLTTGVFHRADSVRQWQRTVNGRQVMLVIAALPARNVYRHACVLFAPDIRNAMPYLEAMREGMRAIGLSGRSTDLPHYQEYGGRLADRRRAHADIFSRSRAVSVPQAMHLAIVYE
jgi:hypothetical protein